MKNYSAIISILLVGSFAFAGDAGYIENGKTTVVYKDGKKVGDWPAQTRNPAEVLESRGPLYYQDDGTVRCYTNSNPASISCTRR